MTIQFRWMTHDDIPEITALAHRIWNSHYPGIITQAQIDYMLEKSYAHESMQRQLNEGQRFLLALEEQQIVGFLSVHLLEHIKEPLLRGESPGANDYYLHKFYVSDGMQGRGLGKALFAEVLKQMPHIKRLRLQVARANNNAWKFYQKLGFEIKHEANFDIGNGFFMEDYVMEKTIAS